MKKPDEFFDRISFPTEYNTREELKSSIILLFITCALFFLISSTAIIFNFFIFSKTLLLGTIAYELILIYLLNDHTKKFIETKVKGKAKTTLSLTSKLIFGLLMLTTFATLIYTMITPTPVTENKFISLTLSLLIIVAPTFYWHELVNWFKKNKVKSLKWFGFIIIFFLLNNPVMAANDTDVLTTISETANSLQQGVSFINEALSFITNIQTTIQNTLNLNQQQTQVIIIISILIAAFMILKFLSVIIKWVIVVLIAWIIIQMIFL